VTIEREARFLILDDSARRALVRLRALDGFRRMQLRRERQQNTYLDTGDLRLRRARSVLKLRRVGGRRRVEVTFKHSLGVRRGVAHRLEITARIQPSQVARVLAGTMNIPPMRRAAALIGRRALRALFTLRTDRTILVMRQGRARVELDVDVVTFRAGGRVRARRVELEVENLSAPPAAFARAVAALRRLFGSAVKPTRVSKFEYGLRLVKRGGRSGPAYV
jgi:inorganic triphosphatase YgiF